MLAFESRCASLWRRDGIHTPAVVQGEQPQFTPVEELTEDDIAAEVRDLFGMEADEMADEAVEADNALAAAIIDPDVSDEEVDERIEAAERAYGQSAVSFHENTNAKRQTRACPAMLRPRSHSSHLRAQPRRQEVHSHPARHVLARRCPCAAVADGRLMCLPTAARNRGGRGCSLRDPAGAARDQP